MKHEKRFKPSLLALSITSMLFSAGSISQEKEETEVITVEGLRSSIIKSTDLKREASSVIDVITAEDVGKFPDDNVMDSLGRITGVQIQRDDSGTANSFQIRGIDQNRIELNGRSVSGGEGEGRGMNLGDIPSELIAGLEVIKSPTADLTEGSLGATVNLKTARPLSKKNGVTSLTIKAKYGDNVEKNYGNIHAFTSHKWNLGDLGKLGVLFSGTFNDNKVSGDVLKVNGWPTGNTGACGYYSLNSEGTTVNNANNQCNANFYGPNALTLLQYRTLQERSSLTSTVQWRPTANSEYIFDIAYNKKDDNERRDTLSMNFRAGNNFLNPDYVADNLNSDDGLFNAYSNVRTTTSPVEISDYLKDDATSSNVYPLTQFSTDAALLGNTNGQGGQLKTERISAGLKGSWTFDDWALTSEVGYTASTHTRHYIANNMAKYSGNPNDQRNQILRVEDGEAIRLEGSHAELDLSDGRNVLFNWTERDGEMRELLDPRQFRLNFFQDDGWEHKPREVSFKADADYFLDYGHLTTLEFGVRATENIMERTTRFRFKCQKNNNWGNNGPNDNSYNAGSDPACEDPSQSAVDLMAEYPELFSVVDGFFSKENGQDLQWLQLSNDAFFEHPDSWAAASGFGEAGYESAPSEYYKITENTAAAYAKANMEGFVNDDVYYRSNFGVRGVYTDVNSLTTPGASDLNISEAEQSHDYLEWLPSLNLAFTVYDSHIVRFAAAKVMVRPNFNQLKPTGSFNQFTGCRVFDSSGYNGPWPNGNATPEQQELQHAQDQYLDSDTYDSTQPCPGIRPLNGNNVGNLELDPYTSYNYDLSLESYWGKGNSVSAALFYRDVKADIVKRNSIYQLPVNIEDQTLGLAPDPESYGGLEHSYEGQNISVYEGIELWRVKQFENGGASTRYGIELAYTQFLDMLPAPFDGFGVGVNYTYSDGERPDPVFIYGPANTLDGEKIDFSAPGFEGFDTSSYQGKLDALKQVVGAAKTQFDLEDQEALMPIKNMSKHSGNASVFYDKYGINARLSYRYRSAYYNNMLGNGMAEYRDDSERLDLSSGYRFNKHVRVMFNIQNVLREKSHNYVIDPSITSRLSYTDRIYTLGVALKF